MRTADTLLIALAFVSACADQANDDEPGLPEPSNAPGTQTLRDVELKVDDGEERLDKGGFFRTCIWMQIGAGAGPGYYPLSGVCQSASGQLVFSSLNINNCITNAWGHLQWAVNGNFAASCSDYQLELSGWGAALWATCGDGAGGHVRSGIDLGAGISNQNGALSCDNGGR